MPSGCNPSKPDSKSKSSDKGGSSDKKCKQCTITSKTVATSPADRTRKKIGVGEEVELTVDKGPATWTITSGSGKLSPKTGSHTKVTFTASDKAESVTIKATGADCSCTITFTVVKPANWTMKRKSGTNLKHTDKRPDCGWKGIMYVHPNDVNFENIETREKDSQYDGEGSYDDYDGDWHGNYTAQADGVKASSWFPITNHSDANGSTDNVPDTIYTGNPDEGDTGKAPPFTAGKGHFPITMQWRVGTGSAKDFAVSNQEDEIFTTGKCESRKGGNTESTMWNDPPSTY